LLLLIARACPRIIIEKLEKSRKGQERQWTLLGPHLTTGLPLPLPEKSLASPSRKSHIITFIIVIISTYIHHLYPPHDPSWHVTNVAYWCTLYLTAPSGNERCDKVWKKLDPDWRTRAVFCKNDVVRRHRHRQGHGVPVRQTAWKSSTSFSSRGLCLCGLDRRDASASHRFAYENGHQFSCPRIVQCCHVR